MQTVLYHSLGWPSGILRAFYERECTTYRDLKIFIEESRLSSEPASPYTIGMLRECALSGFKFAAFHHVHGRE